MTNRPLPTLPKWIFLLVDLLLLAGCGWAIHEVLPAKGAVAYATIGLAIIAWMFGAWICVWPWILEFNAQTKQVENESLASAVEQLQRLEEVGAKVQHATGSWQSAQDAALRVANSAKEIEERIKADSKDFMEFAERMNSEEKQRLQLELEKMRRSEAEWLQVAARILDHTFALTQAALRSGQENVATQMTTFQTACRDAARRVGLVPFNPEVGERFDERGHQLEDRDAKPPEGAVISDVLATGYTYQGQLLRRSLVRVATVEASQSAGETPVAEPVPETQEEPTEKAAAVETAEHSEPAPSETSGEAPASIIEQAPEPLSEESHTQSQEVAPWAEAEATETISEHSKVETVVEAVAQNESAEVVSEEKPRPRRQRKPDPQASLPF